MNFKNIEEAKQIIKNAEKYIKENDITIEDIEKSVVFKASTHDQIIIPLELPYHMGTNQYILIGNCNKANKTYSDDQQTAEEIVEWLKSRNYKKTNMKLGLVEYSYE